MEGIQLLITGAEKLKGAKSLKYIQYWSRANQKKLKQGKGWEMSVWQAGILSKCYNYATEVWINTTVIEGIDKNEVTPFPNKFRQY